MVFSLSNDVDEEYIKTKCRSNLITLHIIAYTWILKFYKQAGDSLILILLFVNGFMSLPILYAFRYQAYKLYDSFMCIFSVFIG